MDALMFMRRLEMKRLALILTLMLVPIVVVAGDIQRDNNGLPDRVAELELLVTQLATDLAATTAQAQELGSLLQHFSRDGSDIYIDGANLHVTNGLYQAGSVNGLGNVIIGYNELRDYEYAVNDRTGSHMLVIGDRNNYSSYGGMVVGHENTASGIYASVSGGLYNTASGPLSSVSGGKENTASGENASVSGGLYNWATNLNASVSSGAGNWASGPYSSVSGGTDNRASGDTASISGGWFNEATGYASSVSGGLSKTAATNLCVVGDNGVDC
jgi:hypothetical protein